MHDFTPIRSILGGALIGLSAVLLLLFDGRIAGISGMFNRLVPIKKNDFAWRAFFLIGLICGGAMYYFVPSIQFHPRTQFPIYLLVLSGFLVGMGTKIGSGCTSGHGVCGVAIMSPRSIAATIVFLITGIGTVSIIRHLVGIS